MSEKIDILTLLPAETPYFIVDTSERSVPFVRPQGETAVKLYAPGGKNTFQAGDNITILSAGFILPESFVMSSPRVNGQQACVAINMYAESTDGAHPGQGWFAPFGLSGIQLPLENYETPLGVFIDIFNTVVNVSDYFFRTDSFNLKGTLRGLDESGIYFVDHDPNGGLPEPAMKGDVYHSTAAANGWLEDTIYEHNGGTSHTAADWSATTGVVPPRVSMVGVPSSLNGQAMRVTVFVKILHTLAMTTPPPVEE